MLEKKKDEKIKHEFSKKRQVSNCKKLLAQADYNNHVSEERKNFQNWSKKVCMGMAD